MMERDDDGKEKPRGRGRGRARAIQEDAHEMLYPGTPGGNLPPMASGLSAAGGPGVEPGPIFPQAAAAMQGAIPKRGRGRGQRNIVAVEKLEDMVQQMTLDEPVSLRGVTRGRRPIPDNLIPQPTNPEPTKIGRGGQLVRLNTNYISLSNQADWILYMYRVDFNPEVERTSEKKKLLKQHKESFQAEIYIFDGTQLYLNKNIGDVTELTSKKEDGSVYQITIKFVRELSSNDPGLVQILNMRMNNWIENLGYRNIAGSHYDLRHPLSLPQFHMDILPGFDTAIGQHENQLLLNAEVSHKFIRNETVYEVMRKMSNRKDIETQLLGQSVMTMYNERRYKIADILWDHTPRNVFPLNGHVITYINYIKQKYNITIKDPNQPMIAHRPTRRQQRHGLRVILLIPELCTLLGIDDSLRKNHFALQEINYHTRLNPRKRVEKIRKFVSDLNSNELIREEMGALGLEVESDVLSINGRILEPEKIFMSGGIMVDDGTNRAGFQDKIRGNVMTEAIALHDWSCIFPSNFKDRTSSFIKELNLVSRNLGMINSPPKMIGIPDERTAHYIRAAENCLGQQLVLLVLRFQDENVYGAIKTHLSVNSGLLSQCVTLKRMSGVIVKSVATKVAIQINTKLGGVPWNLHVPSNIQPCMVIGFDVYHNKLKNNESYGAVVSSLDRNWTKYHSQVIKHDHQTELSTKFAVATKIALQAFIDANGHPPNMILVFRDGVGEGQLDYVKEYEVQSMKNNIELVLGKLPSFAFIIVTKRINTRLFQQNYQNPIPGTVVDDVITRPDRYDFFLVSQNVNQGTVSPTGYNIIDNSTELRAEHFQRISYKLTHLYFNWQGTVRQPAPCMYAHKLAFMTGEFTHRQPHPDLDDKLWFL